MCVELDCTRWVLEQPRLHQCIPDCITYSRLQAQVHLNFSPMAIKMIKEKETPHIQQMPMNKFLANSIAHNGIQPNCGKGKV